MKKTAVIVAGGSGTRMNTAVPKQFLLLKGRPVLYYTLHTFFRSFADMRIMLVLPAARMEEGRALCTTFFKDHRIELVKGGATRFHSVKNGLDQIEEESIVLVHDGVRCLLTTELIRRCYEAAREFGSAVPVVEAKDSMRRVTEQGSEVIDRTKIRLIQTPQAFHSSLLLPAFHLPYETGFTDEATVVEAAGGKVHLIRGEQNNIKITEPLDLLVAEQLLDLSAFE